MSFVAVRVLMMWLLLLASGIPCRRVQRCGRWRAGVGAGATVGVTGAFSHRPLTSRVLPRQAQLRRRRVLLLLAGKVEGGELPQVPGPDQPGGVDDRDLAAAPDSAASSSFSVRLSVVGEDGVLLQLLMRTAN